MAAFSALIIRGLYQLNTSKSSDFTCNAGILHSIVNIDFFYFRLMQHQLFPKFVSLFRKLSSELGRFSTYDLHCLYEVDTSTWSSLLKVRRHSFQNWFYLSQLSSELCSYLNYTQEQVRVIFQYTLKMSIMHWTWPLPLKKTAQPWVRRCAVLRTHCQGKLFCQVQISPDNRKVHKTKNIAIILNGLSLYCTLTHVLITFV